jgi:hypothetical protein
MEASSMYGLFTPRGRIRGRGATLIVVPAASVPGSIPASGHGDVARGAERNGSMRQVRSLVIVALMAGVFGAAGCSATPARERPNEAWSQRLTQQAESLHARAARQERSEAAWSARLAGQADAYVAERGRLQRANGAWSLRLTELTDRLMGDASRSNRASQAWSDRLNGLAESAGDID